MKILFNDQDLADAERMIQDFEEGFLTEIEHAKLMQMISEVPEVRSLYFDHMETVALLKETVKNREELKTLPISEGMLRHQRRRSAMASLTLGLAALVILCLGFLIIHINQTPANGGGGIVMDSSDGANYSVIYSGDEERSERNLQPGDKVVLSSGLTRFTFPSGVEAIVEGPSELILTSDLSVNMKGGLAWFRVPEAGHGFTVQTKRANIIDLGTEFGVWFDGEEGLQVHVAKGKVRVEPALKAMAKVELIEGDAMEFDVYGRGKSVEYRNSLFRREFTQSVPYLHWSFDKLVDGKFVAKGTMPGVENYSAVPSHLNQDIRKISPSSYLIQGRHNAAFSMRGEGLFAETEFPGIGENVPRTFTAWVRHRKATISGSVIPPYCVWGTRNPLNGGAWKIYLKGNKNQIFGTSVIGLQMEGQMAKAQQQREWMHIASVYTGYSDDNGFPQVKHYVNGNLLENKPEGKSMPVRTATVSTPKANAKPVRFGASILAEPGGTSVDGDLDEVFLFREALSGAQIKQLMEENRLDFFVR